MKEDLKLDENIKAIVNKEEYIPTSIQNKTQAAYKEIKQMNLHKKKSHTKQWIAVASIAVVGFVGIQTPILADLKEALFGGNYKGVEQALEEGQLENIVGVISESNGITVEVIGGMVDPTIIHLRMRLTAKDSAVFEKFEYNQSTVRFVDQFNITDDKGRTIQEIHEEGVYAPPYINEKGEKVHLLSTSTESIYTHKIDQGEILVDLIWNASQGSYTDIKGLTLTSKQLNVFEGDWTLEVPFTAEMLDEKVATYEVLTPNKNLEIISSTAHKTGLKVECIAKVPVDEKIVDAQIINEKGQVFTTGRPAWMEEVEDGSRIVLTFEALEEAVGEGFTLKLPTLSGVDEEVSFRKVME